MDTPFKIWKIRPLADPMCANELTCYRHYKQYILHTLSPPPSSLQRKVGGVLIVHCGADGDDIRGEAVVWGLGFNRFEGEVVVPFVGDGLVVAVGVGDG